MAPTARSWSCIAAAAEDFAGGAGDIPRAIGELERQLLLTTLVQAWAQKERRGGGLEPYTPAGARSPAQAARLARELARLIDELEAEGIGFERLKGLPGDEYAEQWRFTLQFLEVALPFWPAHLAESDLLSPVARRRRLLEAEMRRLKEAPPAAPVIVAGITSADAAATEVVKAILALPNGALVLPALDRALDDEAWAAIGRHPEHPQFGLKRLLDGLGLSRRDAAPIGTTREAAARAARWTLVCEAMRPAGTTEVWHRFTAGADRREMAAALRGLSLIEADNAQEEAEAIALMLRESLERPRDRAMLVTPDRGLARRVAARLAAWGLDVEDLGGEPFAKTIPGTFLELAVAAAETAFEPVALMTLLKHPLCRLGMRAEEMEAGRRTLELACFRAPYFGTGLEGVEASLEDVRAQSRRPAALRRLADSDWRAARALVRAPESRVRAPDRDASAAAGTVPLRALAAAHYATAQALAETADDDDGAALRQGDAGEWAVQFFASLIDPGHDGARGGRLRLPRSLPHAGDGEAHPPEERRPPAHCHLRPLRGAPAAGRSRHHRLAQRGHLAQGRRPGSLAQPADAADAGPSRPGGAHRHRGPRPRRAARRPPRGAHPRRQGRRCPDGALALALASAGPGEGHGAVAGAGAAVARLGRRAQCRRRPPAPAPARAAPARCRAAAPAQRHQPIETWIANPYAIFARHILDLQALDPLGVRPGAALRGQVVHEALGRLTQRYPRELPPDLAAELKAIAEEVLADYTSNPRVAAFWAPRLARFADWFADDRRHPARRREARWWPRPRASWCWRGRPGPFTLTVRADRIDVGEHGLIVTDYKSSQSLVDLKSRANAGRAPQLPLEAAIAAAGGFTGVPAAPVTTLRYVSTAGGEPPGHEVVLDGDPTGHGAEGPGRARAADRRVRPAGHPLSRAAPRQVQVRLRRLYPPGAGGGVVGRGRGGGLSDAAFLPPRRDPPQPGRRRRPDGLGLGERQCRHRQDPRAHAAHAAPAARRHRAGAHPGAHLHQGGRRRDGHARVRAGWQTG